MKATAHTRSMAHSLRVCGMQQPEVVYLDNINQEAEFFTSTIPSLFQAVVPIGDDNEEGLPPASCSG